MKGIGKWLLLGVGAVIVYLIWESWASSSSSQTLGMTAAQFTAPSPTGVYTYGPSGLQSWNAYPPLQPSPTLPTWQLPGQSTGTYRIPLGSVWGGQPAGGILGGDGLYDPIVVNGSPIVSKGAQ